VLKMWARMKSRPSRQIDCSLGLGCTWGPCLMLYMVSHLRIPANEQTKTRFAFSAAFLIKCSTDQPKCIAHNAIQLLWRDILLMMVIVPLLRVPLRETAQVGPISFETVQVVLYLLAS